MKTYVLMVEIDEGYDEFWEDVAKGKARTKVKQEIARCLLENGFNCRVALEDVITHKR